MVYLNPPFWVINGVSLFPDHEDPEQYYFMPAMPRLTTRKVGGFDVPQLSLIKYRGLAGGGGFLNFDVDLKVPDDALEDVRSELKSQLKKLGKTVAGPRLSPVPVVDGTVKLILLGQEGAVPPAPAPGPRPAAAPAAPAPPPRFVLRIQSAARPSLYGDENATFSVQLDEEGTTIVEKALAGELSPIGVVYSLDFLALRRAYSVRVSVDWDRVQTHLEESFGVDALFYSSQVEEQIDKLVENRVILVEVDTFTVDEDGDDDVDARKEKAVAEVREMIKSTFFQSSILPPNSGEPDGWAKGAQFVGDLNRLAVTGGLSAFGGLSYRKVDLTRIDRKKLNATFNERTAVRKTIWPQGHLGGLFRIAKGNERPLDAYIQSIDTNDPYFQKRQIEVIARADFDRDAIRSIDVRLRYGGTPKNVILEAASGKDRANLEWASELKNGAMVRPVAYAYKVTFKDSDPGERPVSLDTEALGLSLSTEQDKLEIVPRERMYAIADVPVTAVQFPWDRYAQVDAECEYADPANGLDHRRTFHLTSEKIMDTFRLFLRDPSLRRFRYRITRFAKDGHVERLGWTTSEDEQVTLTDPTPGLRRFTVVPQVDWNVVREFYVDLCLHDAGQDLEETFEFKNGDGASKTWVVHPSDPSRKLVEYSVMLAMKDGSTIEIPRSVTAEKRLMVRTDLKGHRVVDVAPEQVDLASRHVLKLAVELRYADATGGLAFEDRFEFDSPEDRGTFEFDYVDEANDRYDYRVTTIYDSGMVRTGDWKQADAAALTIPIA